MRCSVYGLRSCVAPRTPSFARGGWERGAGRCREAAHDRARVAELHRVAARRGLGVARALIEKLIAQSPRPLYLMCRPELGVFYERFGFRVIGVEEMPPYFITSASDSTGRDEVLKYIDELNNSIQTSEF